MSAETPPASGNGGLRDLLRQVKDLHGSDLHLAAGREPRIRRHGELEPVAGWPALAPEQVLALLREIASAALWEEFERSHDIDFAYGVEGIGRFRVNYFVQQHGAGGVYRLI